MESKPLVRYRKLRIAWSVWWGMVAVLVCVLGVRSYKYCDQVTTSSGEPFVETWQDRLWLNWPQSKLLNFHWHQISQSTEQTLAAMRLRNIPPQTDCFGFAISKAAPAICVPHWFVVGLCAVLAVAHWLPSRFSLRTLLIATTLVAVALGVVVWLTVK